MMAKPAMAERPLTSAQPVLVFDGVCVLCNSSVQFVLRHDSAQRYRFATVQSETGRKLLWAHGFDPTVPASVLLLEDDQTFVESAAILRVLSSFGLRWRILAATLRMVPRGLRDRLYRFVAQRRYRWFGRREVCMLPDARDAGRFL
jgi:predicted DCC family thiol-disulfide oxidoreductase YuxK